MLIASFSFVCKVLLCLIDCTLAGGPMHSIYLQTTLVIASFCLEYHQPDQGSHRLSIFFSMTVFLVSIALKCGMYDISQK